MSPWQDKLYYISLLHIVTSTKVEYYLPSVSWLCLQNFSESCRDSVLEQSRRTTLMRRKRSFCGPLRPHKQQSDCIIDDHGHIWWCESTVGTNQHMDEQGWKQVFKDGSRDACDPKRIAMAGYIGMGHGRTARRFATFTWLRLTCESFTVRYSCSGSVEWMFTKSQWVHLLYGARVHH